VSNGGFHYRYLVCLYHRNTSSITGRYSRMYTNIHASQWCKQNDSTYFLFVKEALCPSRSSRNPGNNLQCVSGYRSRHNNTVCPGWVQNTHQFAQDSSHPVSLHSMGHEGLSSRPLHLLPPVAVVRRPLLSSTFCEQGNIMTCDKWQAQQSDLLTLSR
jgi:hypothetical protein